MSEYNVRWIFGLIESEFMRAMRKHPSWPRDPVHAAAVLAEEMGELQKAALDFEYHRYLSKDKMAKEAVQLATMAVRFLMNLEGLDYPHKEPCPNCLGTGQVFPCLKEGEKYSGPLVECVLCRGTGRVPKS
jgi:NTP pyrophosphatase (non-canonical NTP hydrolase)